MIPRLIRIVARMSIVERVTIGMVIVMPLVLGGALAVAVLLGFRVLAAEIFLIYYLVTLLVGVIAVSTRLRRWRRFRREQDSLTEASLLAEPLSDLPLSWLGMTAGQLDRARVVRASAALPAASIFAFGARSRSTWIREVYAHSATRGRLGFAELMAAVRAGQQDPSIAALSIGRPDPALLLSLARLLMSQARTLEDLQVAYGFVEYLGKLAPLSNLSQANQVMLAERLILSGRADLGRPLVERWSSDGLVESMLAADILNPINGGDEGVWLAAFNTVHHVYGLEPVTLREAGSTPYDRLDATVPDRIESGPLVSIVMSAFRPHEGLFTAIRSLLAQTWRNWELLVMDDGSGPAFDAVFAKVKKLDPRIRVIRSDDNRGTYVRRNEGILAARGEFVTMHDSDDWAHPRRIEIQARHLLAHPEALANTSASLRMSEDLMFVQPRGTKLRLTETSLLFRRDIVTRRVGFYDSLRKAADSEFRLRLEAAVGVPIPFLEDAGPLSLVRYSRDSLSGTELGDGWMHPARLTYRSAYRHWHRKIVEGAADAYLAYPLHQRPFPAHRHLLGLPAEPWSTDVLLVLDGRVGANPAGHLDRVVHEIIAVLDAGRTVTLFHIDSLDADRSIGELDESLQALVSTGTVRFAIPQDQVHAAIVVVRDASVLQGIASEESGVTTERVVLVEDGVSGRDRFGVNFTWSDVDEVARARFGREPEHMRVRSSVDLVRVLLESIDDDPTRRSNPDELRLDGETEASTFPQMPAGASAVVELVGELGECPAVAVFGAGDTASWIAAASRLTGTRIDLHAIEDDPVRADAVRSQLADVVDAAIGTVRVAPVIGRGVTRWYDPDAWSDLSGIDLAVVRCGGAGDVPAVSAFARLRGSLGPGAHLVLEDTAGDGLEVIRVWLADDIEGVLEVVRTVERTTIFRYRHPVGPGRNPYREAS